MVTRYSPEPGPRLGAVHVRLALFCQRCLTRRSLPLDVARTYWGTRTHLRAIAADIVCVKCAGRDMDVSPDG